MASTIKLKNGSGAPTTGDLVQGEPALDLTNKRLYTENASGVVIEVGTNPSTIDINAGTIDGTVIGGSTPAAITTTALVATTADINAGTIDGTVIGGSTAAAGTFTTGQFNTSLNVDGTVTADGLTSSGIIEASDGTNGEMQFGLGTALTTGAGTYDSSVRWNGSSGNLLFSQGAVEKMRITSTGIDVTGTADVTLDLNVGGAVKGNAGTRAVSVGAAGSVTGGLQLWSTTDGTSWIQFGDEAGTPSNHYRGYMSYNHANDSMDLGTSGSTRATLASNGDISFYEDTGTTAKFFWDASAESLGIGTSSPSAPLDVVSSSGAVGAYIRGRSSDNIGSLYFTSNASAATEYGFIQGRSTDLRIQGFNNGLILQPSSGNVGIGTSSPTGAKLQVVAESGSNVLGVGTTTQGLFIKTTGTTVDYNSSGNSAGEHTFSTGNTERMRIDVSGNLLLGTTSTSAGRHFTIGNATAPAQSFQQNGTEKFLCGISGGINGGVTGSASGDYFARTAGGKMLFSTDDGVTAHAVIDSSGNLLVGTTSATGSGASSGKQVIQFNGAAENGIYFDDTRTAAGTSVAAIFGRGSTAVGRLDTTLTSVALTSLSDERVKNNIVDAPSASDDIDAIQVRSFDWKSDGSHQKYGMVAQELIEVAPEAVSAPEDPEQMMGVDYSKLVPMLIKEVQSLRARVAQLEGAN